MPQLIYLFDPLCGWCYGATPALARLRAMPGAIVQMQPTGLFAGAGARPLDAAFAAHIWQADQRIGNLTGQEFSAAYCAQVLGADLRPIDSSAATLALTAVVQTAPAAEAEMLHAIQAARYVAGQDITDAAVLAAILRANGHSQAAARLVAPDTALLSANTARVAQGRALLGQMGARGVPTLLRRVGADLRMLDGGLLFGPPSVLAQALAA